MERYSENSGSSFGELLRHNAGQKDADDQRLLPMGEPRQHDGPQSLTPREPFDSNASSNTSDPQSRRIYLKACRKSLDFQMEQYLRYLGKVRAARIEPKDLLHSPGIAENGPNVPPSDFWCLIVVRDRLVSQSNILCEYMRIEKQDASQSLSHSSPYSALLACISAFGSATVLPLGRWFILGMLVAGALPLTFLAPNAAKVIATGRCESILRSVIQRATDWDLDEEGREKLESFAFWLQMVL
ncbi:uncharacterized protein FMAN_14122 [Fusarium mangiferae]|uniref:Uncharacterized protein n=1 Tax=Fusarium mangiferae TaxID=192010 RepID=A0A1L7UE06_FUSMA|nr:uncharacterized protein FMAN_14122 [Fusarium mangiferae]CVL08894.1 uncharacterized protein FMAN_14122 [Fusarium mangiferae]